MNVNFEKVTKIVITDQKGKMIETFDLASAQLTKPDYTLTLRKVNKLVDDTEKSAQHFIEVFGEHSLLVINKERKSQNYFNEEVFEQVEKIISKK